MTLPGLWLSKVQVVDAIKIHVFCVPRKGALPHPKVQVRRVDTLDLDATLILHNVQDSVETTDVPFSHVLQRKDSHRLQVRTTNCTCETDLALTDQEN